MTSRGIRNNNPGNIERGTVTWQGMADDQSADPRFIIFKTPQWGLRALAKTLLSYQNQHGLRTVRGIINRWAPSSENNTAAYVGAVAAGVGVNPDAEIDVDTSGVMTPLVKAIVLHENGANPYADAVIAEAIRMAGVSDAKGPPLARQKSFLAQVGSGVALLSAGGAHLASYASAVKGWADQLGEFAGAPVIQHAQTVLLTVAGGLAIAGIVATALNHLRST
jgi:hypothetical protein